jgi:hypothetical protein
MPKCNDCKCEIPAIRLQAVPDAEYCVKCADKHMPMVKCRIIYSHKTAGELFVAHGSENIRRLDREYARGR